MKVLGHISLLSVRIYCQKKHNFQNIIVMYYMFRPFLLTSAKFYNVHGKEYRERNVSTSGPTPWQIYDDNEMVE
jgi:hypothetical protein